MVVITFEIRDSSNLSMLPKRPIPKRHFPKRWILKKLIAKRLLPKRPAVTRKRTSYMLRSITYALATMEQCFVP